MRLVAIAAICLCLCACSPNEKTAAEQETSTAMSEVKTDAAKLADSTGDALKAGAAEFKEGAQDAAAMVKDKTAAVREDLKGEPGAPEKK